MPDPGLAGSGPLLVAGVEKDGEECGAAGAGAAGNRDLVVVAVATHPESCCCCRCSACGQLTGVWCVSTDVILRCQ